jgi:hypothetical protein
MKSVRLLITVPATLKDKLDAARQRGVSASGLIRHLLAEHFKRHKAA